MIQLIILDVDGTLTNGQIIYGNDGNEIKSFNVKDGLGIAAWMKLVKKIAIIIGKQSKMVENRPRELNITYNNQDMSNKAEARKEIL